MQKPLLVAAFIFFVPTHLLTAQTVDSSSQNHSYRYNSRFLYVPSVFIIGGIALNGNGEESFKKEIAEERNEHFNKFGTKVDNYLQFSPIAIAYGLDALGYKSKTPIKNRTVILLKGELLMTGVVYGLKKITRQLRPDNSSYSSFPSGHTAQAFAAATFLSEEYKGRFKWMPYLAYSIASSVGMLRMANNKHYISDILAGAGLGVLSMKTSYIMSKPKRNRSSNLRF